MPTPSLIIPSAPVYDEGNLYGLNVYGTQFTPEPIPFTRATTATRTNAAGLIELVPYNLLRYSEQFDNAAWLKLGIGGGINPVVTANASTAPDGTLTAERVQFDCTSTSTSAFRSTLQQSASCVIGNIYTSSIYVKAFSPSEVGKQLRFVLEGGGISSIITITADWQRVSVTGTPSIFTPINFLIETRGTFTTNTTADVLIWGAQAVEGTDPLPYLKTETRLNRPRVDFSLGGCPNLLLEPQRTNLALQSSSFDNASWPKTALTVAANSVISPSGIQDADTLTANGTLSFHSVVSSSISVTSTPQTASIYVKKNTNNFIQIAATAGIGGMYANFDIANGVVGSVGTTTGSNPTNAIQSVGNGWYRCSMTYTPTASGNTNVYFAIAASTTDTRLLANTLSTSVFLWGAQFEAGAYPTTYIPTTTASVTRNADSFTESNIFSKGIITAAGGTWFVEVRNNRSLIRDSAVGMILDISAGGFTNGFVIRNNSIVTSRLAIEIRQGGSLMSSFTTTTDTAKIAIKWNGTTADVFQNGVKVVSATAFTTTNMDFLVGGATDVPKYIQQMELFPTPLSDDELEEMTGLGFNTYPLMANYYNYITQ